jgi:hypothetical protein
MTYAREPMTFESALDRIVERLGQPAVLRLVGKAARTLAGWSNPADAQSPPIALALTLDRAWRDAGGAGAPMLDTYRRLFEANAPIVLGIDIGNLPDLTVACIREGSQAEAALVIAMMPGATELQRREASREVTESIAVLEATLPHLMVQVPP